MMVTIAEAEPLLRRLFAPFKNLKVDEAAMDAYAIAIEDYCLDDLQRGIELIFKAQVPGYEGAFAPSPTQLAKACRIGLTERLERLERRERARPPRPPAEIKRTPAELARVKRRLDDFLGRRTSESSHSD